MAQKLIKIKEDHYVIVDDLKPKDGDFVYDSKDKVIRFVKQYLKDNWIKKITHSTQPLYKNDFWAIQELKLSEVKELLGEVDVEKKASEYAINDFDDYAFCGYVKGYNQALEDNKEKKYTEEDVISIVEKSRETGLTAEYLMLTLQPKTEWEVEIVDGKLKLKL